jgi:UDP-N-acetylmuramoyl-tripeptide--D-alanyl-D-alanine ligase
MEAAPLRLRDVVAATGGTLVGQAPAELVLPAVGSDSRTIPPGGLFVALEGRKHDGHDFVADAFAHGAGAALVERVPARAIATDGESGPPLIVVPATPAAVEALARQRWQASRGRLILICGSVGKQTTAELTSATLGRRGQVVGYAVPGGLPTDAALGLLQARTGLEQLVLEFTPATATQAEGLLALARPEVVVVTSLEPSGPENTGPPTEQVQALGRLVQAVPASGAVVLNSDDPTAPGLAESVAGTVWRYGLDPEAAVRAERISSHGVHGSELDLVIGSRRSHLKLPLVGLHSVHSALAAAAVGLAGGLELGQVIDGLQRAITSPRIVVSTALNGSRLIDDSYSASTESTLEALSLLADLGGRKIAVLGDVDVERADVAGHWKVGNRAAMTVSLLLTVGERARLIAEEARRLGLESAAVYASADAEEAVRYLRPRLRPGDNVLVKGAPRATLGRIARALRLEG